MPQDFNCPNCGAPLDYTGGDDVTLRCPFCNTSVIVPDELRTRAQPAESAPTFDVEQFNQLTGKAPSMDPFVGQTQKLQEIGQLVRAGQKIEAIKLYRQIFNVGLKEAKDAVEALAASKPVQLTPGFTPPAAAGQWVGQAQKIQEMMRLIQADRKIEAIKIYREIFGVGLKEAKDAVEALAAGRSAQFTSLSMGTPGSVEFNATTFPRGSTTVYPSVTSKPRASKTGAGALVGCLVGIIPALAVV